MIGFEDHWALNFVVIESPDTKLIIFTNHRAWTTKQNVKPEKSSKYSNWRKFCWNSIGHTVQTKRVGCSGHMISQKIVQRKLMLFEAQQFHLRGWFATVQGCQKIQSKRIWIGERAMRFLLEIYQKRICCVVRTAQGTHNASICLSPFFCLHLFSGTFPLVLFANIFCSFFSTPNYNLFVCILHYSVCVSVFCCCFWWRVSSSWKKVVASAHRTRLQYDHL